MRLLKWISQLMLCFFLTACSSPMDFSKATAHQNTANINVELGLAYLQRGDVTQAKQKLLVALQQAPHWPPALDAMGYFLEHTGSPVEAEKYYLAAIKCNPTDGSAQNNYGVYLCQTGRYRQAMPYFLAAIQDPDYLYIGSAYENAGLCALKIPDKNLAKQYFAKAVMYDPHRSVAMSELGNLSYISYKG